MTIALKTRNPFQKWNQLLRGTHTAETHLTKSQAIFMPYQVHNMCVHEWTCELQNTNPQYQVHIQHAHFRMCTCVLLQTTEAECTKPTHTLKFDVKSLSICFSQFMNSYTDVTLNPNVHNWWEKALFHFFFNETPSNAICHQGTGIFSRTLPETSLQ